MVDNTLQDRPMNDNDADLSETNIHSFIIKIWFEELSEEIDQFDWRGHITHVPSGRRQYLKELNGILSFITPYLERAGVKLSSPRRVGQSISWWKRKLHSIRAGKNE
jgi:hypothetical protein